MHADRKNAGEGTRFLFGFVFFMALKAALDYLMCTLCNLQAYYRAAFRGIKKITIKLHSERRFFLQN